MLLPYCLLVRIKSLMPSFEPIVLDNQCSPHWEQMIDTVLPSTLTQSIIAILLIFVQGVMLNRIVIKHRLTQRMTLFPAMIYILLCSILVENLSLTQFAIGNLFAIISLSYCVDIYKKHKPELALFSTGFWLGVAILCSPIYLLMFLPVIWALVSLRTFSFKELFQIVLGVDASILIIFAVHYSFGSGGFIESYFNVSREIMSISINPFILGYLGLNALGILLSILSYGRFTLKKSLPSKKKIDTLYLIMLSSMGLVILNCDVTLNIFYYLWIPLSILISMFVIQSRVLWIFEVLHVILLAAIINNHFNLLSLI